MNNGIYYVWGSIRLTPSLSQSNDVKGVVTNKFLEEVRFVNGIGDCSCRSNIETRERHSGINYNRTWVSSTFPDSKRSRVIRYLVRNRERFERVRFDWYGCKAGRRKE